MAYQDALTILAQLLQLPDAATCKANIIAMMQAADPPIDATAFILGEPTERWIEASADMMDAWGAVPTMAVRAMFLRLATDPHDVADDGTPDQSADQTPRPGMLSVVGASFFGTIREDNLYATGFVQVTNPPSANAPVNIKPYDLTFERDFAASDGGSPTYRNIPSTQYTNLDGSLTIPVGASVTIPVQADQIGSYANATSGTITVLVTQSFGALTVTNVVAVLGRDRESRQAYIARCLLAPDANAPGGPVKAYLRAMNTAKDGAPLVNYQSGSPVAITAAQVLPSSATGAVTGYLAGPSGAPTASDVSSSNANITGIPLGLITDPIGVLHGVSIGPQATDPGTGGPGFAGATNTQVNYTYTARIPASKVPGGGVSPGSYSWTSSGNLGKVFLAIDAAIASYLVGLGPGAKDQDASGNGVVYPGDIESQIAPAQAGLYGVNLTVPSSPVTVSVGHIAVQGTPTATITVVAG